MLNKDIKRIWSLNTKIHGSIILKEHHFKILLEIPYKF